MKNRLLILTICLIATIKMMAQEFTLHGKVVDENNQPLEFAIVSVASQGKTAVTSLKGDYSLKLHSADSVVVKFSYIGFKTKTKDVCCWFPLQIWLLQAVFEHGWSADC